jgi:hypothetical protein
MGKRALVAPVFFASEGRLYGLAWTFSALSAVGILEGTERQQSAKSGHSVPMNVWRAGRLERHDG